MMICYFMILNVNLEWFLILYYCLPLWYPTQVTFLAKIESIQKEFVKYICRKTNVEYHRINYSFLCSELDLIPFDIIYKKELIVSIYNVVHKHSNPNLLEFIKFKEPNERLRFVLPFRVPIFKSQTEQCIIMKAQLLLNQLSRNPIFNISTLFNLSVTLLTRYVLDSITSSFQCF